MVSKCPRTTRLHVQDVCDVLDTAKSANTYGQRHQNVKIAECDPYALCKLAFELQAITRKSKILPFESDRPTNRRGGARPTIDYEAQGS
eukprot:6173749-Pleurochrysis_carterae.AAC.2